MVYERKELYYGELLKLFSVIEFGALQGSFLGPMLFVDFPVTALTNEDIEN